jgi:hypothetical protein
VTGRAGSYTGGLRANRGREYDGQLLTCLIVKISRKVKHPEEFTVKRSCMNIFIS